MSIATKHGDKGETSLIGGKRVSKGELRVEAYGTIDELISSIGYARSICKDKEIAELAKSIQRELFAVSSAVATPGSDKKDPLDVTSEMIEALTSHVYRIEQMDGILQDWSIPGEHPASAAFDLSRTVCRRAERYVIRVAEEEEDIHSNVIAYLNRLSDLLWLIGRLIELREGIDASLRDKEHKGSKWSRAW
jgi:cob(I)alamin adenosyltransferase